MASIKFSSKSEARQWAKNAAFKIERDARDELSKKIVENIKHWLSDPQKDHIKDVFLFHGMPEEPWIVSLCQYLKDKNFYLPRMINKQLMEFRQFQNQNDLKRGPLGIMEPAVEASLGLPSKESVIFVPCMSVSLDGSRLGHGNGYYDRYLAPLQTKPDLCAVAFEATLAPNNAWMSESHDIRMDYIVTENGVVNT